MKPSLNILRGELERLFSTSGMTALCQTYLAVDAQAEGIADDNKANFARQLVEWAEKRDAAEALADAVKIEKKGMTDPRLKHVYAAGGAGTVHRCEISGFKVNDKIFSDDGFNTYACESTDEGDDTQYWFLLVNPAHSTVAAAVQRFLVACRLQTTLDAPFVPQFKQIGQCSDGSPYLICVAPEGNRLSEAAPLSPAAVLDVAADILEMLFVLEEKGLLFGDLRAENLLMNQSDGGLVALGIGFDKLFATSGWTSSPAMTAALAPEVLRGEEPTVASDLYALGCLLFFLFTGKPPFQGRCAVDVAAGHLKAHPAPLEELMDEPVAPGLKALIDGLMARDLSGRVRDLTGAKKLVEDAKSDLADFAARSTQTGTREDIEEQIEALAADPSNEALLGELKEAADVYKAYGAATNAIEEIVGTVEDQSLAFSLMLEAANMALNNARDFDRASYLFEQLAGADPSNSEVFDARLKIYRKQRNYDAVMALLGERAEAIEEPAEKRAILLEIAKTLEKEAGEPSKAFDYYLACIYGDEQDKEIISSLEKIGRQTGRLEELVQTAGQAATTVEGAGNTEMIFFYYKRLGQWYTELLNPQVALTCYQKVMQLDPGDVDVFEAVAQLYRGAQQWLELAQLMSQRAEVETIPAEQRKLRVEIAKLYFERMGEIDASKQILVGVLQDDPGYTPAAAVLRKIYEKTEDYANLVEILQEIIDAMGEGPDKVSELFSLGEIYEVHLNDPKEAAVRYAAAVEADSSHLDSLKGLDRVYALTENYSGLRDVLEKQLAVAVTAKQKIALLLRLATMYEEEFKDLEKAVDCYRQVVAIDEEHGDALLALIRHLRKLEQNEELVDILAKRAALVDDVDEKRALLSERVKLLKEELKDVERATEAVNELAALGGSGTALVQIVRSQIELGQLDAAEKTYQQMVDDAVDVHEKVNLMIELAAFQLEKLENLNASEQTLQKARALSPENPDVISELAEVLSDKGDYAGALELLAAKIEMVKGSEARAKVYAQMGIIALDKIKDQEKALGYLEQAVGIDNSNLSASERLAGLYREAGRFEDAITIYERWVPSAAVLTEESRQELFSRAAEVYEKVGRKEKALELFQKTAELDDDPATLKRLADVALENEQWTLAREKYERYAKNKLTELSNEEKVELFVKRGQAAFGGAAIDEAAKMARQATVLAPDDIDARLLLAKVHEARKDYRGAVEARCRALELMAPDDERRFSIVRSSASLMFEKLRNAEGAADLLKQELKKNPKNRDLLGDLLKMHYAAKKFKDVVQVILQIADLVDDDVQLSRYYLTVAKVYRRELRQLDQAVVYFKKALAHDDGLEDARDALVQVLTELKDWEGLESVYKAKIAKLGKDATVADRMAVFAPLADLYMSKLDKESDAIILFETMSQLEPDNVDWQEKLVELYGWNTKVADKSLALHRKLLERNVARVDSYRMMYRIFSADQDPDKAWCAASMLSLLNQAAPDERQYYKDYLCEGYPPISDTMDDDRWNKLVYHADMNKDITNIFKVISGAVMSNKCQPIASTGLAQMTPVDFTTDPAEFSQLVNFGFGVCSVPAVPLYYQTDQNGFGLLETNPPVLLAGADAAEMKDYLGLAFRLGQQLTLLRPGLVVKHVLKSGTELSSWLLAAVKIFVPQLPVPNNLIASVTERLAPLKQALSPEDNERLKGYVQAFVSQAADVDLKKWARSVDYSGDRAGLILCGDVAVAVRVIESEVADEKERAERIRQMSLFVVSDEYFELRKKLGVALQAG